LGCKFAIYPIGLKKELINLLAIAFGVGKYTHGCILAGGAIYVFSGVWSELNT
jgi:hypothetical protein